MTNCMICEHQNQADDDLFCTFHREQWRKFCKDHKLTDKLLTTPEITQHLNDYKDEQTTNIPPQ